MAEWNKRVPIPIEPGQDWYDWLEKIDIDYNKLREMNAHTATNGFHEYAGLVVQQHHLEHVRSGNSSPYTLKMTKAIEDLKKAKKTVKELATDLKNFIHKDGGFFEDLVRRKGRSAPRAHEKKLFKEYTQKKFEDKSGEFYRDIVRAILRAVRPIEKGKGIQEFRCLLSDMYQEIAANVGLRKDEADLQRLKNKFPKMKTVDDMFLKDQLGLYIAHHCILAICSRELNWVRVRKMTEEERQNPIDLYKRSGYENSSPEDRIPDEWYDEVHKIRNLVYLTDDMINKINDSKEERQKEKVTKYSRSKARFESAALRVYQSYPGGYMNCRPSKHLSTKVRKELQNEENEKEYDNILMKLKEGSKLTETDIPMVPDIVQNSLGGRLHKDHRMTILKHRRFEEDDFERVEDVGDGVRKALNNLQETQWKINVDFIEKISEGIKETSRNDGRPMRVFNRDFKKKIREKLADFCVKRVKCPRVACSADICEPCREKNSEGEWEEVDTHDSRLNIWAKYDEWKFTLDTIDRLIWHYHKHNSTHLSKYGPVFWHPYACDFRGRLYSNPNLSPQGEDFQKAAIVFREARPLGERGVYWLRVQVCNLYGKMKGRPFDERAEWTERKKEWLCKIAENPMKYVRGIEDDGWWSEPRSKNDAFLRLASTMAMKKAWDDFGKNGGDWDKVMSNQPVHLDATINGYQHISALLRSRNLARKVNVIKTEGKNEKSDLYQLVADCAKRLAKEKETEKKLVKLVTGNNKETLYKIFEKIFNKGRSFAKPIVMTSAYGAGKRDLWKQFASHNGKKNGIIPKIPKEKEKEEKKWKKWKEAGKPEKSKPKYIEIKTMWHKASFFGDENILGIDEKLVPPENQIDFVKRIVELFTDALDEEAPEYSKFSKEMQFAVKGKDKDNPIELEWELPTGFKTRNRYPERSELKMVTKTSGGGWDGNEKTVNSDRYWGDKKDKLMVHFLANQNIIEKGDLDYLLGINPKKKGTHPTTAERSQELDRIIEAHNSEYGSKKIDWNPKVSYIENLNELIKQGDVHQFAKDLDDLMRSTVNCTFTIKHRPEKKSKRYESMTVDELRKHIKGKNRKRKTKKTGRTQKSKIPLTGNKKTLIANLIKDDNESVSHSLDNPKIKLPLAIAANYVHSLDGAHLAMIVNKMADYCQSEGKGLDFWPVHDSFGTHAADIDRLRKVTLESFKELHTNLVIPEDVKNKIEDLRSQYAKQNDGVQLDLNETLDSIFFID